ncbi:MAG TPA: dTDP-glucose 4,6-dehydratase [candidate division Zixibacteria bacterium]|nr:dTDP-glucose 4,6-dehydratase [candidate division Zixibacteria bacterium]
MRRILVTGGAGFIGSNFIRYWLERHPEDRLVNLDKLTYAGNLENLADVESHPSYRFVRGDICDATLVGRLFAEEGIDTVVHFAAESHVDRSILGPDEFIRTNIQGTFTLLEAARKAWLAEGLGPARPGCRFVHVSTDEVYGSLGPEEPSFSETTAYAPNSPYSASKASSDHLVRAYHHTYRLPTIVTHCSNNYGPFQFPEKLIPLVIQRALKGEPIPVYGDGGNVRDWLYVEDHCRALEAVLERGGTGESYNIGGSNQWHNIDLVRLICDLLDRRLDNGLVPRRSLITLVQDRPGHDRRYAMDTTKIRRELGWCPIDDLPSGIAKTVDWYLAHRGWVERVITGEYKTYFDTQYGKRLALKNRQS